MKTIFRIARTELAILFFSPIAWLVLVVFTIQTGIGVSEILKGAATAIKLRKEIQGGLSMWLSSIFSDVQHNMFLYIPLLTMGLMSRELHSGSIKLLYSSPVKIYRIVIGKYLSVVIYGLILVFILSVFLFGSSCFIVHTDFPLLFSGLLGVFLGICVFSAIGLLMSSLTSYQVIAAISTFAVIIGLGYVGRLWQQVIFVRDITSFLSISRKSSLFFSGLICTRNIFYFAIIIPAILIINVQVLTFSLRSRKSWLLWIRILCIVVVVGLLSYLSSRPRFTGYADVTRNKVNTIAPVTQRLLEQLKTPLTITSYVNILDNTAFLGFPDVEMKDQSLFEAYQRFLPEDIRYRYVYYYDTPEHSNIQVEHKDSSMQSLAKMVAGEKGILWGNVLPPEAIKKEIDLTKESNRLIRTFEANGKRAIVRVYDEMYPQPTEQEIAAGIKQLIEKSPLVCFVTGHSERSIIKDEPADYFQVVNDRNHRISLVNQGFEPEQINLDSIDIPAKTSLLVLADPKTQLPETQMMRLKSYLDSGGNMLIMGEPERQGVMKPLLDYIGVRFEKGEILQQNDMYPSDLVQAVLYRKSPLRSAFFRSLLDKGLAVSLKGCSVISVDSSGLFDITPLLIPGKTTAWQVPYIYSEDMGKMLYNPLKDKRSEGTSLAVSLTRTIRGKSQKLAVFGDADFMSFKELGRSMAPGNMDKLDNYSFILGLFSSLTGNNYPIDVSGPDPVDISMRIDRSGIVYVQALFIGIFPLLLIISGGLLLSNRKKK